MFPTDAMFSSRVPGSLQPNRLAQAVERARSAGRPLLDLTVTNPTVCGFEYPDDILTPLSDAEALRYRPDPFGLPEARAAVAADYARRGIAIASDRIVLTASTSEAYSFLLKLLCAPEGHAVMVPAPSYPLFDHLTRLDGVEAVPYTLDYHGRWHVDFVGLERSWSAQVRAVLAVSPNNPTGSLLVPEDLDGLGTRCRERAAALVIDEVFADYPLGDSLASAASVDNPECLVFRLGGLSKSVGLPQVKLAWIAVDGPEELVRAALDRLELISDTYLSVATSTQLAARSMLERGTAVRAQIQARVCGNYAALRALASSAPAVDVLHADAGWSAVLRVPATRSEEALVLDLLEREGVLVHPGYFFDFAHESFLVVSLLPERSVFEEGVRRILEAAGV